MKWSNWELKNKIKIKILNPIHWFFSTQTGWKRTTYYLERKLLELYKGE